MNIQRFHAPTAREALAKARHVFGDAVLILSNRPTEHGVEVVATSEETLDTIAPAPAQPKASAGKAAAPAQPRNAKAPSTQDMVERDADQLAMSTLSFQDYVRERMLRREMEEGRRPAAPAASARPAASRPTAGALASAARALDSSDPIRVPAAAPQAAAKPRTTLATAPREAALPTGITTELHAMKELIEERFNTLTWLGQVRQNPIHVNLMLKLIRAGYSPTLARAVLSKMPENTAAGDAVRWVMNTLAHNLKTDAVSNPLHVEGGIFALVGATGVGKTTTAAKLAGLCAQTYGPGSVGLITLDTYRIGAHEQLRSYGRMLGIVAHLAHDQAALQDLLGLLSNKKMVLIDTTGMAPRDPRKREMLSVLDLPHVKRLLVLNAGGHGDTLDQAIAAFRTQNQQQAILTKLDETAKLGPALDAAIRHQLMLRGVTTGQRVPEDWESADATKLVRQSMRSPGKSAFDPQASDLNFFFAEPHAGGHTAGSLHV